MKKFKVLLVGINSKYIHSNLAVRYLRSYTKDLDYDCSIREFSINDRTERILKEIINEKPDVIAFSCYIWNIEMIKELSKLIKIVNEEIEIIYGGPEVSFNGYEFLKENSGEYLIEGEGEETFRGLINYKLGKVKNPLNETQISNIKGLFYKENGEVFYTGQKNNMDINDVIFPYSENDDLSNKIVYYEASRGCPYGCKYCLSSVDRNLRFRDMEKVKRELKFFMDKEVRLVKFVDRTFNCNEEFSLDIWKYIIEQDTKTKFHFEISANILTKRQIEVLSKAPKGRIQFEVGVQTTNNEILRNINRYVNFEDISQKVKEIQRLNNISQHLDLIAGLPGENLDSFKKSFNEVYSIKPEEIQLGFLKMLKGSPMMKEKDKWGIKYSPYPPYEVLKTKDISYEELLILKRVEAMVDKYYNSGKFNNILNYLENEFSSFFEFYYELSMFFEEKGYFDRNISGPDYYKVFLEFNNEKLKKDNKPLKNIIKYDYLKFNKKKWIPKFLEREIDKKWARQAKEMILDRGINISKNDLHLEKFDIDIFRFINKGDIVYKDTFLVFDEINTENIKDVTNIIFKKI